MVDNNPHHMHLGAYEVLENLQNDEKFQTWKHLSTTERLANSLHSQEITLLPESAKHKLIGLAEKIYDMGTSQSEKDRAIATRAVPRLIKTIADAYSSEKDAHGATLKQFFEDNDKLIGGLAEMAYQHTPAAKQENRLKSLDSDIFDVYARKDEDSELHLFTDVQQRPPLMTTQKPQYIQTKIPTHEFMGKNKRQVEWDDISQKLEIKETKVLDFFRRNAQTNSYNLSDW